MAIQSSKELVKEVIMPEFKYAKGGIIETIQFINAEMKEFDSEK